MIRAHPYVGVVSLLTMAAIMTAGVVGVLAAADTETRHRKDAATGARRHAGGTAAAAWQQQVYLLARSSSCQAAACLRCHTGHVAGAPPHLTVLSHLFGPVAGFANNAAVAFEVQLQQSFAPLVAMAAMIHVQPYYPILAKKFDEIAAELIAQVGYTNIATTLLLTGHSTWCPWTQHCVQPALVHAVAPKSPCLTEPQSPFGPAQQVARALSSRRPPHVCM